MAAPPPAPTLTLPFRSSSTPYYDRNLPKLCSFWCLQTCNRVVNSACPYRPCNGTFRFPELASTHQV